MLALYPPRCTDARADSLDAVVARLLAVALLLALCAAMTVEADSVMRYFGEAAKALHASGGYVDSVLSR